MIDEEKFEQQENNLEESNTVISTDTSKDNTLDEQSQDEQDINQDNNNYNNNIEDNSEEIKNNQSLLKKIFIRTIIYLAYLIIYFIVRGINTKASLNIVRFNYQKLNFDIIMYVLSFVVGILLITSLGYILFDGIKKYIDKIKYKTKNNFYQLFDILSIIPLCINITIICISFLFTFASVEGSSMYPTLNENSNKEDLVFVSYNSSREFSDIVVAYINPIDNLWNSKEYVIKRIIGMPGDEVTWKNAKLCINNVEIDETYLSEKTKEYIKHAYNNFDGTFFYFDDDGVMVKTRTIPTGYYFVMGDNRDGSADSRLFGLIPEENIIGVVKKVIPGVFKAK